jgi:hypothetical protein
MALVNPNIALGVKSVEIQDPMAQYAKIAAIQGAQNQNALNQYQLSAARRADETQNALARAYSQSVDPVTGKIDYNKLTGLVAGAGGGAQLPAIQKSRMEYQTAETAQQKAQVDLLDAKLKQSRGFLDTLDPADPTAPARYLAWHEANHKDPIIGAALTARGVSAEQARQSIEAAIAKGPAAFAQMLNQSKLGTEKFMEMNKPTNTVGPTGIVQIPGLGGTATVVQGTDAAFQMTPAQVAQNKIAQEQLEVSQGTLGVAQRNANISDARLQFEKEKATQPQFNAQAGGFIAPPTKENPEGKFIPAKGIQATKDQGAAVKALQSAGYDPVTGEDTISKLIAKSTSGGLQAGGAATLAFFGKSTEGRKAISALEGTANQIATDLAGGKLGAGISNTDREFIVGALGDVANPMKTADERLAGWNAAKQRMMITGLIPLPKTGSAAPAAPAAGANVVVTPDGQTHTFPTPAAAAQFKKAAGIP